MMIEINGTRVPTRAGETLLAAGERAGLRMPKGRHCDHTGEACEECRLTCLDASIPEATSMKVHSVLACRTAVEAEARYAFDPFPREMRTGGEIIATQSLGPDILELVVRVDKPIPYLPGQHVEVAIGRLPPRALTPTLSLDGLREIETLHFHIRQSGQGALGAFGARVLAPGERVKVTGPFGQGFLRRAEGRLVFVSSGTGFAAIWSMAVAARLGQPHRPVHLIASAHDPRHLYMRPALEWLARQGVDDLVLTASGAHPLPPARGGRAIDHLPSLTPADHVHVAGHPGMVRAVLERAARAGARGFGIPYLPAPEEAGMMERLAKLLKMNKPARPRPAEPVEAETEPLPDNVRRLVQR
jgi:3-phenylpropionate/trans-cinnamate dioxygenase ferredoxin reductase subunit